MPTTGSATRDCAFSQTTMILPTSIILGPGWSGVIDLGTLTLRRGAIPKRDFLEAVQWTTDNRLFLLSEWKRLNERD